MNILIIGATSGIGKALFEKYIIEGNRLGIVGRRTNLLDELYQQHPDNTFTFAADIIKQEEIEQAIHTLCTKLKHIDLAIVCSGTGNLNPSLDYALECPAIDTNVRGWTFVIDTLYNIFEQQGHGHLVAFDNVNLILNYDIPHKAEDYVHRIGRTARAGKDGLAISFIGEKEIEHFARIEKLLERVVEKSPLPEGFGEAPEYAPGKKPSRRRRGGSRSHRGGRKFSGQRKTEPQKSGGTANDAKPRRPHRRRRPNKEVAQN